jgi:hypothetical protein
MESNHPTVGLPRLTGFEHAHGARSRPPNRPLPRAVGTAMGTASRRSPSGRRRATRPPHARRRGQVPVAVQRDRDAGVPHEARQRLGVHARRDHQRRERVAALVEAQRAQLRRRPRPRHAFAQRYRMHRHRRIGAGQEQPRAEVAEHRVIGRQRRQPFDDRHRTRARLRRRLDETPGGRVPRAPDSQRAGVEVDGRPLEREQFAQAQPGVERQAQCRLVARLKRRNQPRRLDGRRDPIARRRAGRQPQPGARVDAREPTGQRARRTARAAG